MGPAAGCCWIYRWASFWKSRTRSRGSEVACAAVPCIKSALLWSSSCSGHRLKSFGPHSHGQHVGLCPAFVGLRYTHVHAA